MTYSVVNLFYCESRWMCHFLLVLLFIFSSCRRLCVGHSLRLDSQLLSDLTSCCWAQELPVCCVFRGELIEACSFIFLWICCFLSVLVQNLIWFCCVFFHRAPALISICKLYLNYWSYWKCLLSAVQIVRVTTPRLRSLCIIRCASSPPGGSSFDTRIPEGIKSSILSVAQRNVNALPVTCWT